MILPLQLWLWFGEAEEDVESVEADFKVGLSRERRPRNFCQNRRAGPALGGEGTSDCPVATFLGC